MVVRRDRTRKKVLGHRTHGHGDTKNNRGYGTKGGHGRAGSHKHKFTKYYDSFGVKIRLKPSRKLKAINLDDLNREIEKMVENKTVQKLGEKIMVDGKKLNIDKLLGRGELKYPVIVKNMTLSERAMEKIFESNGEVEGMAAPTQDGDEAEEEAN